MRKILKVFAIITGIALPGAAFAACEGRDLIAALPAKERAALQQRADSHAFARGNLWRAERAGQVIHLAGTYHLPDPRHEATLATLAPLIAKARVLLVEASPKEEARLKAEIARRPDFMVITDGPPLSEQLSPQEWDRLAEEARARGIPPFMAARFRPWYMAMILGLPPCATQSLKEGERGLDHQLVSAMEERGGEIRALEPFDTLFSVFGALTAEEEIEMIRASLFMAARPEDMTVTLANAYFAGQSRLLWEFSRSEAARVPELSEAGAEAQFALMDEVLMSGRNRRWLGRLLEAATEGPVLAAFGALHLSGDEGVLQLLAREGFTLTPL